jgi:PAS domain S-box-containing protein
MSESEPMLNNMQQEQTLRPEAETAKQQLESILSSIRDGFYALNRDWQFTYVSDRYCEMVGMQRTDLLGQNIWELFPAAVETEAYVQFQRALAEQTPIQFEYLYLPWNCWHQHRLHPSPDGLTVFLTEITDRKQAELILVEQKRLLELIATGTRLEDCLAAVCASVAKLNPHLRACFLLTDAQRQSFPRSITPGFPSSFEQGLADSSINELCVGTCGEAMFRGQPVTCQDIANDDRWSQGWRNLCLTHGILACHSQPVIGTDNLPLGSLMLCFNEARTPTGWEQQLADFGTQIASIAFERDRINLDLQESEERFRTLAEHISQFAWTADANGWIFWYNRRWFEYTGTTLAEMQGWGWQQVHHPDHIDRVVEHIRHCFETGQEWEDTFPLRGRDGSYRWFLSRAVPIRDEQGEIVRWFGTNTDVTDLRQVEAELRQKNAILDAVNESAPTPIFVKDRQGKIIYANPATLAVLGKSAAEVIGARDCDLYPSPEDAARVMENDQRIMALGQTEVVEESPDGIRTFLGMKAPYRDEAGDVIGLIGIANDISDRVQVERDREQILQQEQAARSAAERANRIKDEFLAVLSHELRSPLNPILGWSKLLQNGKLSPEKTRQALETIERNAKLQSELIEDLLDVSRILRGKLSLNISPVSLAATLGAAIETVRLAAEAKSITVQVNLDPEVGQVAGDATRLQQVIWNLLSNAVKFTPPGGQVEVELAQIDQHVRITVSDTGKGISPDFLPHVFEYFQQADSSTTRQFGGLGLGLAIVRHLVELHGGTVQVESLGEGLGATFIVKLPLLPSQVSTNLERPSAQSGLDLTGVQVLIIDDEADSREFAAFVLEQAGATVVTAATAGEGFLALTQSPPDLLLSDIGMPDMDGYMLMQQIRALPAEQGGQVKAIALTAYAGEINYQQAMAAGFQRHISKPVEPEELVQAIGQLLAEIP